MSDNCGIMLCGKKRATKELPVVNVLLLGTGGSGKSTVMKLFWLLYGQLRDAEDNVRCGVMVRANIIGVVRKLMVHLRELDLLDMLSAEAHENKHIYEDADDEDPIGLNCREAYDMLEEVFTDKENRKAGIARGRSASVSDEDTMHYVPANHPINPAYNCKELEHYINHDSYLFEQHVESVRMMWQSETMQKVWSDRCNVDGLFDAQADFFPQLSRIASPGYVPLESDILTTYLPTNLVNSEHYDMDGTPVFITDAGGRFSQRKQWTSLFGNMDVILLVMAINEYDQYQIVEEIKEDHNGKQITTTRKVNKLVEAIQVFEYVAHSPDLKEKEIILFLNKQDLFGRKIREKDIQEVPEFKDYKGPPRNYEAGMDYFMKKIKSVYPNRYADRDESFEKRVIVTNAMDVDAMDDVFEKLRVKLNRTAVKKLMPVRRKSFPDL